MAAPFLFKWRDAFSSPSGPPSTTRLVLWVLNKHMNEHGERCWPSIELIAKEAALTERCVVKHLGLAERLGWIARKKVRSKGATWPHNAYVPLIPDSARTLMERGSPSGVRAQERGALPQERRDLTQVNHVPTNSSENSSKNSPKAFENSPSRNSAGFLAFKDFAKALGIAHKATDAAEELTAEVSKGR